ncbi:uncharacterized protein LOC134527704 isoform X2 [Bacillus rossius redtenbacheri]
MTRRTTEAYEAVLRGLIEEVPTFKPATLMSDFKPALRSAFRRVFPNVSVKGCWFHYAQAIFRRAQQLGMARTIRSETGETALKMLMALPLLPTDKIISGVQTVEEYLLQENMMVTFQRLTQYIRDFWIGVVTPSVLSVNGLEWRTNNAVESFYRKLLKAVGGPRPEFWHFITALRKQDSSFHTTRRNVERQVAAQRTRRRSYVRQDENIQQMQGELSEESISIKRFLQRASWTVSSLAERLLRTSLVAAVMDDEVTAEDEFQDDTPPEHLPDILFDGEVTITDETTSTSSLVEERTPNIGRRYRHREPPYQRPRNTNEEAGSSFESILEVSLQENGMDQEVSERVEQPLSEVTTRLCMICNIGEPTNIIVPCHHQGLCDECVAELRRRMTLPPEEDELGALNIEYSLCPYCRTQIHDFLRIHIV